MQNNKIQYYKSCATIAESIDKHEKNQRTS